MASSIPVFPLNAVSYAPDRAITNPGDVLRHFDLFERKYETIQVRKLQEGPDQVYHMFIKAEADPTIHQYKYNIGPVEVSISRNVETADFAMQVHVMVPIVGHVLVGATTGDLKSELGYVRFHHGNILTGYVDIQKDPEGNFVLQYKFKAFGEPSVGEIKIF
ncbi:hypothetical protein D9756_010757 [Leucocoprinus leucothites]|uniref:Uncharacterized protein n=1 Tax=Leucocoprinus leucothites TaxID=201217 RepID=A0A8H5CVK7_9AGAR|nr:hypothetical protein D9756_010757 [Leucoagaricus leucothites]